MVRITNSVAGVLVPTIFCFFLIYYPWEAWVIFKHLFENGLKRYFATSAFFTMLSAASCAISYLICQALMPANSMLSFTIRLPITLMVHCGLWWLFTHRSTEYDQLKGIVLRIVKR